MASQTHQCIAKQSQRNSELQRWSASIPVTSLTNNGIKFVAYSPRDRAKSESRSIDALFSMQSSIVVRTGCQWRFLPRSFPNWKSVYTVFWRWQQQGAWEKVHDRLREKARSKSGRKSTPTVGIIDCQSIRTTEVGGDLRGYDAGKKISGRKRHIIVDTTWFRPRFGCPSRRLARL